MFLILRGQGGIGPRKAWKEGRWGRWIFDRREQRERSRGAAWIWPMEYTRGADDGDGGADDFVRIWNLGLGIWIGSEPRGRRVERGGGERMKFQAWALL